MAMATTPDTKLLERSARDGDAGAFGQLLRLWDGDLRGVAWSVARSAAATDDIMQDAYERAFRAIDGFNGESAMKTWLHSIVYRSALDFVRYEDRRAHDDASELGNVATTTSGTQPDVTAVDRSELASVLEACTLEERAMLMLTTGLGYSFDETAAILDMKRGTVASRVGRVRARLSRWEEES